MRHRGIKTLRQDMRNLAAGLLRPKGVYANLTALNAGTPTSLTRMKSTSRWNDGNWYHNGTAFVGGVGYQGGECGRGHDAKSRQNDAH